MCVCLFKLSNMNISATSWPITTTFYLKHHWGGGKGCIRFWTRSDWNSGFYGKRYFHKVIMGKILYHSSAYIFDGIFIILADTKENHNILDKFEFRQDSTKDCRVSCP